METGQYNRYKPHTTLLISLALCLAFFLLAIKLDLFAWGYSLLLPQALRDHGFLDEYLSFVLLPALMLTFFLLYKLGELKREVFSRKMAEEALRESEERFRLTFDQSAEGIVFAEYGTGAIVYANATMEKLLGDSREEFFAAGMPMIYRHFDSDLVESIPDALIQRDFIFTRVRTIRKDGTEIVVSLRIRLVKIGGKELEYLSLRDMTDKVRLEHEARITQAKLIQANKMTTLGMLVSGMAHEINNPNNYIMFNSHMLTNIWNDTDRLLEEYFRQNGDFSLGGLPYPEVGMATRKLIAGISEGSERIKIIVDDLKDYARQDNAETDQEMDINDAIHKAVAILAPQIKKHTAHFHLNLQENIPKNIGNIHKMERVIINLLLNALQALPDKKCGVTISSAAKDDKSLVVIIKDEGSGMTNETLSRLTESFFTTRSASSGTGLGLFISQSIIDVHKGTLRFESAPGSGTTAIIELPLVL